jgi:hypothetical protein
MLFEPAQSVTEVLQRFAGVRMDFQSRYRRMLSHVLSLGKPTAVCTIYDTIPGLGSAELTALALFNEIILREAFAAKVPLIDLRLVFSQPEDYSALSPIEPSAGGGEKLTRAICRMLEDHDFSRQGSVIYG